MINNINNLPIGIFDSGVGGLTVLRAISECLPNEDLIYLGDTARLPYGTKSPETVASYALQASSKLVECGVKMLVIACNTATAAALNSLRKAFAPLPVIGVIEPGARAALEKTHNNHIAVIATEGTIQGRAYHKAINNLNPRTRITGKACTLFVPLAEEGWLEGEIVESIARRYLDEIFLSTKANECPDTLLLGCTHFPPLRQALANVIGNNINIVDSAATTAKAVMEALEYKKIIRSHQNNEINTHYRFITTDDTQRFSRIGSLFFGKKLEKKHVEHMDL